MLTRVQFFTVLALVAGLPACSSPQSQERLTTVLCWLRPSCLPSDLPPTTANASQAETPSNQNSSVSLAERTPRITPQAPSSSMRAELDCHTSAQITVTASNPFVTVSYLEPTTKANGHPLTNLAKTTIYHDLGKGLLKYKEIKATNPGGGGTIQEKVFFSLKPEEIVHATICVTATDTNGREG